MKIIKARSPFTVVIDFPGQLETKVELFLWNKPDLAPALPNYTFSSKIVSLTQPIGIYNVANEIQEFLLATMPVTDGLINQIDSRLLWCNVTVKTYYKTGVDFVLLETLTYIAVNGYRSYQEGLQSTVTVVDIGPFYFASQSYSEINLPSDIGFAYKYPFIDLLIDAPSLAGFIVIKNGIAIEDYNLDTSGGGIDMYRIPLLALDSSVTDTFLFTVNYLGDPYARRQVNLICEAKYKPMLLSFIGQFGGWEHIYCFKANEQSIETKSLEFKSNQSYLNFNPNIGQRQNYNTNGKKSIKLNTGFVEETITPLIEQLFLSETVTLDGLPVILKSKSSVLKQAIKEKNINYTIDLDYNFNLMNDVV